jgi:hypothetical protein
LKIVLSIIPCPVAVSTGVASRGDNPGFRDFACNCYDIKRCVAAEERGEIHEARVVIASADANGNFRRVGEWKARELYAKILAEEPLVKPSPRGPIFILTPAFLGIVDDDEPW